MNDVDSVFILIGKCIILYQTTLVLVTLGTECI